jgi:uncharacterized protein (TIGR03437 family)
VNAASYQGALVSTQEIVTIFDNGLGPPQFVQASVPQAGVLPTSLADTRVLFGGNAASLLYVQDKVVSAIVPYSPPGYPATVTLELGGVATANATVLMDFAAPGLFTLDESGKGNVAAVNADGSINSPMNPAKRGTLVLLYGTGMSQWPSCLTFGSNLLAVSPPVEVEIGGERALVLYAGSVPGITCAAQQVNIVIPSDSGTGPAVPLSLLFAGSNVATRNSFTVPAQSGLTLAIQ